MKMNRGITLKLCLTVIVGVLAFGNAAAQKATKATEEDRAKTKTKQAQAVSKEVYDGLVTSRQCGSSVPMYNPFLNR